MSVLFPASLVMTLSNLEGEESFEASLLGQAEEVVQERICDDELILVKGYDSFLTRLACAADNCLFLHETWNCLSC